MAGIGTVIGIVGSIVSAVGTIASGNAQRAAAEYQAQQLDIQAKNELATAQQEAQQVRRNKDLVLSRQRALTGASGLGGSDPTVVNIANETAGYGHDQEMAALAGGLLRKNAAENEAVSARATGQAQQTGAMYSAFGSIAGGFSNAFQAKYGSGYSSAPRSGYGAYVFGPGHAM